MEFADCLVRIVNDAKSGNIHTAVTKGTEINVVDTLRTRTTKVYGSVITHLEVLFYTVKMHAACSFEKPLAALLTEVKRRKSIIIVALIGQYCSSRYDASGLLRR
jgi:hypothetical protein